MYVSARRGMVPGESRGVERLDDPPAETPPVATADALDGDVSVTLYLRSSATPPAKRRQVATRARFDQLVAHDVLPTVSVEGWQRHAEGRDFDETHALDLYDEFSAAVGGRGHLDPFFRERNAGFGGRSVVLPVLCLVLRREGTVTGLYPCWHDGTHWSVEDGLRALETGDDAENLG